MPLETALATLTLLAVGQLTREVFGNIPAWAKTLFYLAAAVSLIVFSYGCYRRVRLWRLGRAGKSRPAVPQIVSNLLRDVLLQQRVKGRGLASVAHLLLFSGFVVLFIGTVLIAVEHLSAALLGRAADDPVFHQGLYFAVYEIVMDTFGLALMAGVVLFAWRRARRPSSVGHNALDWCVLVLFFVLGGTGYLIEGLRIIIEQPRLAGVSFVGLACAWSWETVGVGPESAGAVHFGLWWLHAVMALGLIAVIPYTRLLHVVAGALNLATSSRELGVMQPVSIEELEETGFVGVGAVRDFSSQQLLMMDACVSCGRCDDACPALEAGKPLSPKSVVQDLRAHLNVVGALLSQTRTTPTNGHHSPALHGDTIAAETLWSCTTCSACVDVCPLGVSPLGMITDLRRFLVGEAELRGSPATALQKTQRTGNPWGLPAAERFAWAEGLKVPTVEDHPDFELLYWVGCAASYDRRTQKVARAVVKLLQAAGASFAVLGSQERCTGEAARRMGDEFLFQELAASNVQTLGKHRVHKIVTHCPHCLNSLRRDYPQFGGNYEVIHHSQLLMELLEQGRIPIRGSRSDFERTVTYHDPCYLARVNGQTEAPRKVIETRMANSGNLTIIEMPRTGRQTSCCGAGGGRMWFDDAADERIGRSRVQEALDTGASTIAVGCPFCLTMMSDGVAARDGKVEVKDIAELLLEVLDENVDSES